MSTSSSTTTETRRIEGPLIVGGSLGGLSTALALSAQGIPAAVLERTAGRTQRGVAIRVAGGQLQHAIGPDAYRVVSGHLGHGALQQGYLPHAWWDVYQALRAAAAADPAIQLIDGANVVAVGCDDDEAWARTADGRVWAAEVVIGADGYRSVVRGAVDAERANAGYAGYVLWLGQSELPEVHRDRAGGPTFFEGGRDLLAVYPLIEADEKVRRFGWGWFDPRYNDLLRRIGAVRGSDVMRTPRAGDIPDDIYDQLAEEAARKWDEPWRSGVIEAFRNQDVVATPISEYLPEKVTNARLALVGDAAHAQTPMTGAGFDQAVADAAAMAEALHEASAPHEGLARYELMRLADMRRSVSGGQSFSRSFAAEQGVS
ncbi:FAD-dependent monooxygenase [Saccharopolyspora indica]|uniref:FAD-dependent monooxygenase n=1 Tax=Saccharopolyspora indica TaxID=1229659 RepID=UPI0022EAEE5D|nr:FAD-dependent monooxygenase [Saccharopolyspora indica]MDA3644275.1 FAD-dependent monooxygenase [Saccharopolyspora indica]